VIGVFDEKPSWRAADVYLRKARIYVVSLRRGGKRGWVHAPSAVLDEDVSDRELGGAVLAAVAESAEGQNVIGRYEASRIWRGPGGGVLERGAPAPEDGECPLIRPISLRASGLDPCLEMQRSLQAHPLGQPALRSCCGRSGRSERRGARFCRPKNVLQGQEGQSEQSVA